MLALNQGRQTGVTLVELMVGMVISLIVIAIVGTLFINTVRGGNDALRAMKLNHELRAVMNYMVADLRRAGFWEDAAAAALNSNIPFVNPFTDRDPANHPKDVWIHDFNGVRDCIMYSYDYDHNNDGKLYDRSSPDVAPLLGFRLNNGVVQAMQPGWNIGTLGTSACKGRFEGLTDPNTITVTELSFSTEDSQCRNMASGEVWAVTTASATPACALAPPSGRPHASGERLLETRQIRIQLTGHHAMDPQISMTLSDSVKIRNNRIIIAP